jgi:ferredoxin
VEECIYEVPNDTAPAFNRVQIDPLLCIGCKKCISKGPLDTFLEGCPWDAIDMITLEEYETRYGVLPY